jgi:hypothetical protein
MATKCCWSQKHAWSFGSRVWFLYILLIAEDKEEVSIVAAVFAESF